jgi:putative ABC transport system permease protein
MAGSGWRRLLRVRAAPKEQAKRDVDEELAFHLDMRTDELVAAGFSRAQARAQAELEFGDVDHARTRLRREATSRERGERRTMYLDELRQDLRYGVRALRDRPGFTAAAVLTLALGVAATTTVFTVFDGVVLRPLPIDEPERVVVPHSMKRGDPDDWSVTYADFVDWQEQGVFAKVGVGQITTADMRLGTEPERLNITAVTGEFFAALGGRATLGRLLGPADMVPSAPRVMVISHKVWQTRFGGAADVIGRTVGQNPRTIVGVLERGADWPRDIDAWVPLRTTDGSIPSDWMQRDNYIFMSVARLKAGTTLEQTRAQLAAMARVVEQANPSEREGITVSARPLQQEMLGRQLPRALTILLAAVAFVLLIGCANIANLLLVRGSGRRREFAVRMAMGARPVRLARQLMTESLMLGALGGLAGVLLAKWGVAALLHYAPADTPRLDVVSLDWRVLLVGIGASLGAAALFGLAPVLQASRVGAAETLADTSGRSVGGRYGNRVRRTLVIAELALSVMLLVGAGLLVRSLLRLQRVDPGFRTDNTITLSLRLTNYASDSLEAAFYSELTDRLRALPGVTGATIGSALPLGGGGFYLGRAYIAEGRPQPPAGPEVGGPWNVVGPGYFATMGTPLLRGREFTTQDRSSTTPVAIVNEEFVRRMFPGENPVGKRFRSWRDENLLREIVGVVGNVRYYGANDETQAIVYVPHAQNSWSTMSVIIRTARDPNALLPEVRRTVNALDPNIAIAELSSLADAHRRSIAAPRFNALLLSVFATLALLLATIGIYGVLAYGVSQRSREIGVRMALGARRNDVIAMVLGEAMLLVAAGLGIGLIGALATTRFLGRLLFELNARDPATFAAVAGLLGTIALVASFLPARRATGVQPVTALRD